MLKISSTWINGRMDTSEHRPSHPFNGPRAVANGLTGIIKCAEVCLHFGLQLNTRGFFSDPKDKNLKQWGREKSVGLYLEKKLLADINRYDIFSFFWCAELIPEVCRSILGTPCIYIHCFHYMTPREHDISAEIIWTRWISSTRSQRHVWKPRTKIRTDSGGEKSFNFHQQRYISISFCVFGRPLKNIE